MDRRGARWVKDGELEGKCVGRKGKRAGEERGTGGEDKWRRMEQEGRRAGWELKKEEAGRENSLLIAGKEGTIGKLGGR